MCQRRLLYVGHCTCVADDLHRTAFSQYWSSQAVMMTSSPPPPSSSPQPWLFCMGILCQVQHLENIRLNNKRSDIQRTTQEQRYVVFAIGRATNIYIYIYMYSDCRQLQQQTNHCMVSCFYYIFITTTCFPHSSFTAAYAELLMHLVRSLITANNNNSQFAIQKYAGPKQYGGRLQYTSKPSTPCTISLPTPPESKPLSGAY